MVMARRRPSPPPRQAAQSGVIHSAPQQTQNSISGRVSAPPQARPTKPPSKPSALHTPIPPTHPVPRPVSAEKSGDKTLDDVILAYLSGDGQNRK
jgi:hypothetical protein